jgi:hypothetical protein
MGTSSPNNWYRSAMDALMTDHTTGITEATGIVFLDALCVPASCRF